MKLKLSPLVLVLLGLVGAMAQAGYQNVSVQQLYQARSPKFILDVREPYEFAAGHVAGAKLIPLGQLAQRAAEIPRNLPVYVICRSGNRSAQASQILVSKGFSNIHNVQGGLLAWQAAGYPVRR
ncbi:MULTISPECIES: rhodanese-like domain-containing protein [unclassified Meiothermus]|uniref:rhodanese-like domain-containing protein n=1 Tax=unclassified Meiothermus TaxID=370471 RepID=UPI000D7C9CED|nr:MULTISPECIES: rhodanese-like domain-containing protein [unclassified Meiothermus]PZA06715.1 rhodanese-like domain-containing protein [Meiothermus sp. Pnk-1]RYM36641.1 rhodanese-like domain-containing protein [Meiothermus sp. PNK-Is4]